MLTPSASRYCPSVLPSVLHSGRCMCCLSLVKSGTSLSHHPHLCVPAMGFSVASRPPLKASMCSRCTGCSGSRILPLCLLAPVVSAPAPTPALPGDSAAGGGAAAVAAAAVVVAAPTTAAAVVAAVAAAAVGPGGGASAGGTGAGAVVCSAGAVAAPAGAAGVVAAAPPASALASPLASAAGPIPTMRVKRALIGSGVELSMLRSHSSSLSWVCFAIYMPSSTQSCWCSGWWSTRVRRRHETAASHTPPPTFVRLSAIHGSIPTPCV